MKEAKLLPANFGPLRDAGGNARITGPCGDTMEFWVRPEGDRVARVSFTTDGCGHSMRSGSAAAAVAEGKTIGDALRIGPEEVLEATGGLPEESRHCALLAADTLRAALLDCRSAKTGQGESGMGTGECGSCGTGPCEARPAQPGEKPEEPAERQALKRRLDRIRHKILVLSGKGGVGKSTVAVNLAVSLVLAGKRVGLLDADLHGPSVPKMLGVEDAPAGTDGDSLEPVETDGLKVMSIGFLLDRRDQAVIWRGPLKMTAIRQFLGNVAWGDLDFLIIDLPPGTGDEPMSVCQFIEDADGAVVVTTPQEVSVSNVRRSINFCRALRLPVLGIVENMSGFACPQCGRRTEVFGAGGGERMAEEMGIPFLGRVPLDPMLGEACEGGKPYIRHFPGTPTSRAFEVIREPILKRTSPEAENPAGRAAEFQRKEDTVRMAIPLAEGLLAMHFGHCAQFALIDVDPKARKVLKREDIEAPPHQPGLLPSWLAERGVQVVIAGGMGQRALGLFAERGIKVVVGAPAGKPEKLAADFMADTLRAGENVCDH
jgi:Mrp family chromosome partitioning ATPase/predicted Fe-Mo cluster-binding NifX family protein